MGAFAMYRLPFAKTYTKITQFDGEPEELHSYAELSGKRGFCVAPFFISESAPVLVIRPDRVEEHQVMESVPEDCHCHSLYQQEQRLRYAKTFERFHSALKQGNFRKLVLARSAEEKLPADCTAEELFSYACLLYPRTFVALVSASKSGTWLVATPEILLDGSGNDWRTVALAGTMKLEGSMLSFDTCKNAAETGPVEISWTTKNIQEQHYVATYIKDCLTLFSDDVSEEGPLTVRAGNLVHLRSDFRFTLACNSDIGRLIECLHPTPAVCGLPKQDAYRFILDNEMLQRRYYSGFMGPLDIDHATHLYVSLRCMQIDGNNSILYAGGGLLKDSIEEQEWNETEAKLETMRRCIAIKRM